LSYQNAIQALEKATQVVPTFPFYWQDLAILQMETGRYEAAQESIRKGHYWGPYSQRTQELIKSLKARKRMESFKARHSLPSHV
jgi:N-formylglutamate amidohydrolase